MANALQDLYDKRANVWSQMEAIKDRGFKDAEDRKAWDVAERELDVLTDSIEEQETTAKAARRFDNAQAQRQESAPRNEADRAYSRAFASYVRNGVQDMDTDDRKALQAGFDGSIKNALGIGSGAAGGYTVPPEFRDKIIETQKYYGPMINEAEIIYTDSGAPMTWATNDDTSNMGALLAENSQISQQDATFAQGSLSAYVFTSKLVLASLQLLQDRPDVVDAWLPKKLGQRVGRILNNQWTIGAGGGSAPQGIVTGTSVAVTGSGSFASTGGISYNNLVDIVESLDPAYGNSSQTTGEGSAPGLNWMMNQSVRKAIRKLTDSQGHPLWEPSVKAGLADLLLGYPVLINNDMATLATSSKSLGFGNISEAYVIRIVRDLQVVRLTERYADYLQVGFFAFERADGTVQDPNAFKLFQTTATA
ncbi:MAG: phage major capsid protein [Marmoricola sp.]